MKKNNCKLISVIKSIWKSKLLMAMRATLFVVIISISQVIATNTYSQNTPLSLDFKNTSIKKILSEVEDQSDFYFIYDATVVDVERKISIALKNKLIPDILNEIFENTNVAYKITDRQIALTSKNSEKTIQQQKTVSGKVTDSSSEPLPGVTVVVKNTTQGTVTNGDGEYVLANVPDNAILQFSFVGMKSQEIEVGSQAIINIQMIAETIGLEEVVAIGYGTMKKSDLTGSVSSVQGELISDRQTLQLSQGLQGAIPGLMVTKTGNKPGDDATIRIRGITSINNSNPLYIIDGVPGSISDINPNDIANISVLKDAASASIYGSRAASGVILIETKRARTGTASLNYEVKYSIDVPTRLPEYVGAVQSMKLYNESRWNDAGNTGSEYPLFEQDLIENYATLHAEDPYAYPDYNWLENTMDDFAPAQNHQLTYTMGTEKLKTKASLSYAKSDKLYNDIAEEGAYYERMNVRVNNDLTINNFISGTIDFYYSRILDKEGVVGNNGGTINHTITPLSLGFNPGYTPFWENGRATGTRAGYNNPAILKSGGSNTLWENRVGGKISLDITLVKDLQISMIISPRYNDTKRKDWRKKVPYYDRDDPDNITGYAFGANSTFLNEIRNESYNVTSQLLVNYAGNIQNHNFNLMAGYENYSSFSEDLSASSDQFELSTFPYLSRGNENYLSNDGNAYELAYRSYFGRLIYNYNRKYLLQANFRYDGSSRFHSDYRWGFFPSVSLGWVLSEEKFMKSFSSLSFLKIRTSWGVLGNDRIGNYPYQSTLNFGSNLLYEGNNIVSVLNAKVTDFAIEDISWETTETYGFGIDAYFFNNKLRFTGDYYKKTTHDMLLALEIPDYMGVSNPDQNSGKMNTKGWEAEIGYSNKTGDFSYSVSANLSDFISKMGDLGGTEFLGTQIKREGSEFNEWYGYKSDGLFQTEEELTDYPTLNSTVRVGDIKLLDISGPDGKPDGIISPDYDRVLLGGSMPRFMYGGNINMKYKNVDLSLVFQGVGKQNKRILPDMVKPYGAVEQEISEEYAKHYWSAYNTTEENLNAKYPRITRSATTQMFAFSDFWMFNGAYFRLKNIMLGYNLPSRFVEKCKMQNIRVYGNVSNVFSIDNYYPGWDPESSPSDYWITRTFLFGLSVTF
ncbi:SusC/RagA family TonB-linked outer membrane protein [Maribellus comscasis]|uniref:SusC/RagA family TonB-linked outer membrane protein n=1 Tax=Maribellus comscasis TaxID=2681766 RepID=A0A6I6K4X5_9BACT|nr:TonB-dependent receptor [Maribellus comscasis]QGY47737.1 SusC/RagA family TonB-linked outer membrane protein [Maribellus comscasis]